MARTAPQTHSAYRAVDVQTASQAKLILMLYDGAIRSAEEAVRQMDARRYDSVNNHLIRAQEIVNELRASLNMKAGDVAVNLDRLYEYIQHRLMMANIRKEKSFVNECIRMMSDLRNTWKELFDRTAPEELPQASMNLGQLDGSTLNLQG